MSQLAGAVAGGLVAGLSITALLLAGERKTGRPSELAEIKRAGARQLGFDILKGNALSGASEQAVV